METGEQCLYPQSHPSDANQIEMVNAAAEPAALSLAVDAFVDIPVCLLAK